MKRTKKKVLKKPYFKGAQSEFAQKVYSVVARIPKGATMSYGEVARCVGNPKAARAVGNALNKNLDTRVPCHRVVRADGSLGGYAFGGSMKKRSILKKEGVVL
jgi:O-6-methylguanine DNA methyltransferase